MYGLATQLCFKLASIGDSIATHQASLPVSVCVRVFAARGIKAIPPDHFLTPMTPAILEAIIPHLKEQFFFVLVQIMISLQLWPPVYCMHATNMCNSSWQALTSYH